jgi:energy-converting hydrogenase Eha subunit G
VGVDPQRQGPPEALPAKALIAVAFFVGVLYAVGMAVRGDLVPGLVGGALAGVLTYIVLRRAQEQRVARWRRREANRRA